jgi:hypothetical protein
VAAARAKRASLLRRDRLPVTGGAFTLTPPRTRRPLPGEAPPW